jgi:hypothetical protein
VGFRSAPVEAEASPDFRAYVSGVVLLIASGAPGG